MTLLTTILVAMGGIVVFGGALPCAFLARRRRRDGGNLVYFLFAALGVCGGSYCFTLAYGASIVPIGTKALDAVNPAARTLLVGRLSYTIGLLAIAVEVHFALRYARRSTRYIALLYLACLAAAPLVWAPAALRERTDPVVPVSSWANPVPWVASVGPLLLAFTVFWGAAQVYVQIVLYRHAMGIQASAPERLLPVSLVRLGLMEAGCLCMIDSFNLALGWAGLLVVSPVALILMVILVGAALRREHKLDDEAGASGRPGSA